MPLQGGSLKGRIAVLLFVITAAVVAWTVRGRSNVAEAGLAHPTVSALPTPVEQAAITGQAIAFYEARVRGDRRAAADRANLSSLYLQRSRETGDFEDVIRAEETARQSLAVRAKFNSKAFRMLAASLLAQHRFTEALEVARELVRIWPEDPAHRALLGEIQMELGDYEAARITFGSLESARDNLAVAPRLARWAEINGRPAEARRIFEETRRQALPRTDLTPEQMAWYHFRVGDIALRHGELDRAEEAFRAGLGVSPDDYRILSGMARLEAARRKWEESIAYGERAINAVLDPATLALMSEVSDALGDSAKAAEYAKVMEVSILNQMGALHRDWGLFLLDHGRRVPEVSSQAAEEIRTRRDIYGYDLLAWALHKQGRDVEAKRAMSMALRLGTQDPMLFYHAGMIERALGNDEAAQRYLRKALKVNKRFHPTHPAVAEAVLDSIAGKGPLGWLRRL